MYIVLWLVVLIMALDENSWLCEIGLDLLKMKMNDGDLRLLRHAAIQIRLNGMK